VNESVVDVAYNIQSDVKCVNLTAFRVTFVGNHDRWGPTDGTVLFAVFLHLDETSVGLVALAIKISGVFSSFNIT
jgi:hypothetical protein